MILPLADAFDHELRFVLFVIRGVDADRFALAAVGPQVFAHAGAVVRYQRIRGFENIAAGTVILFQPDDPRAGKILFEAQDVFDLGATPGVDGLIIVTHDERFAVAAGQQPDPGILNCVGVLKFVDQNVPKAFPVVRQQFLVVAPQFQRAQ